MTRLQEVYPHHSLVAGSDAPSFGCPKQVLLLEEGEPGLASNGAGQWRLGGPELYPICGDGESN